MAAPPICAMLSIVGNNPNPAVKIKLTTIDLMGISVILARLIKENANSAVIIPKIAPDAPQLITL